MLYREVLLYYLAPAIGSLLLVYGPVLGRRDGIKFLWLGLMATLWTTPWDNWIISQFGWQYPPNSILGRIWLVPLEEHAFFIFQPVFLILVHSICTHHRLLPFDFHISPTSPTLVRTSSRSSLDGNASSPKGKRVERTAPRRSLQTLPRRTRASLVWLSAFLIGLVFVSEAHGVIDIQTELTGMDVGRRAFYLGWILVWISPVIGALTWLGGRVTRSGWTAWAVGSLYLCLVDTIGIRSGAWSISQETTLGVNVIPGLPLEEFVFFLLTSYLIVLSASLIDHLHTLLILAPSLPPCPPTNPVAHIYLLAQVSLTPPPIDVNVLDGLKRAEETLKKGSKSFSVAKLAFGREMRIGLVATYSWCRVTDNLIDDPIPSSSSQSTDTLHQARLHTLDSIRKHLQAAYASPYPASTSACNGILDTIPNLPQSARSAFRLFSAIIPRLVPIDPFLELCDGYETDTRFAPIIDTASASTSSSSAPSLSASPIKARLLNDETFDLERHLPIKTSHDLLEYADDVAGSIAAAICYLAWSILETPFAPTNSLKPVCEHLLWSHRIHAPHNPPTRIPVSDAFTQRIWVVEKSRQMGRALQLVNISRDIAKDAVLGRLYVPLSSFPSASALLDILLPSPSRQPSYAPYSLPLLRTADQLRESSEAAISDLPRTARGGTRAMVASYFEIGVAIRAQLGEVDERGVRVSKWRRAAQAARAMWLGG